MKILLVEDDPEMGSLTQRWLEEQQYETELVTNGMDALIALAGERFAAAAIDVMLPAMSGFEVCRRAREAGYQLPILLLTARDAVEDRVFGLDAGADDYLTKPFDFTELGARLRALIRRDQSGRPTSVRLGELELDSLTMQTKVGTRRVMMSLKEFSLLRLLLSTPDVAVSRAVMLEQVWGGADRLDPTIVEQYIGFLRRKIDPVESGVQIVTVRGVGYSARELL